MKCRTFKHLAALVAARNFKVFTLTEIRGTPALYIAECCREHLNTVRMLSNLLPWVANLKNSLEREKNNYEPDKHLCKPLSLNLNTWKPGFLRFQLILKCKRLQKSLISSLLGNVIKITLAEEFVFRIFTALCL